MINEGGKLTREWTMMLAEERLSLFENGSTRMEQPSPAYMLIGSSDQNPWSLLR
jgi:hypothetical protein